MPFIAIAAVIVLALGGEVTYAADQSKPGDALYSYKVDVNDNIRHEYHAVRASLGIEANSSASATSEDASQQTNTDADASSSVSGPRSGLMIRTDATSTPTTLNADGSVKVNIY